MVDSTRQTDQSHFDPQEEVKIDLVAELRNAIQVVENTFEAQMAETNRELYGLKIQISRLVQDKADPLMPKAKILAKIEKK